MSEDKDKGQRRRRLRRGCIYPLMGVTVILCGLLWAVMPSAEEMDATETAAAAQGTQAAGTAVAQATIETWTPSPEPSATGAPTITPLPTSTPPPTETPLPEEVAADVVQRIVGETERLLVTDLVVTVRWRLTELSTGMARRQGERDPVRLACGLMEAGVTDGRTYQFTGTLATVNTATGQEGVTEGVEVILPPGTYERWNCENAASIDLAAAVRGVDGARFDVSPLLAE